jgi:hypothetical protein
MATFNAEDIVGKTLYAKTAVPLKRRPEDTGEIIFTVDPGKIVGVVDAYINPKAGRNKNLYWQFSDGSRYFYAEHIVGRFDLSKLQVQGTKSLEEEREEEKEAAMTLTDKIGRWLGYAGVGVLLFLLVKSSNK